jgi:mannose-6-phosphate isomerase-like protein (cupin superfamily)
MKTEKYEMKYIKIFADEEGETHFKDVQIDLELVDFAPPAPPLMISQFTLTKQYAFVIFPSGWFGDWHPTPKKQVFFILSGELEVSVSDGERRQFGPGIIVLVVDTTGKGHVTKVLGSEDVLTAVVQLDD